MKKALAFVLALLCLPLLFSCSADQQPEASQAALPSPTVAASEEPSSEPTVYYSPTTGMAYDAPPEYKPMSVMIENQSQARPQTGFAAGRISSMRLWQRAISPGLCASSTTRSPVSPALSARHAYTISTCKRVGFPADSLRRPG